jgi:aryl-alcohol dehydrogenase-like predicted oxidoreductase
MQYRFLGNTGTKVSVISLGGWLTHGGHTGNEVAKQTMKAAYEAGVNFFDSVSACVRLLGSLRLLIFVWHV